MTGAGSRRKGHAFERAVAKLFREIYGEGVKRGFQTRGGGAEEPDVVGTPFHLECKVGKKHSPRAALAQAIRDAKPGMIPVAIVKDDRKEPFVCLRLDDFLELARENHELSMR